MKKKGQIEMMEIRLIEQLKAIKKKLQLLNKKVEKRLKLKRKIKKNLIMNWKEKKKNWKRKKTLWNLENKKSKKKKLRNKS